MAQKSPSSNDQNPSQSTPEERYLDLWEENTRLVAANGQAPKSASKDD